MTHERDLDRESQHDATPRRVDDAAPGRASSSASLNGPAVPVPSGILMRTASGGVTEDAEQAVARAGSSSGHALPADLRDRFESSLGTDLSGVRVHTGGESQEATGAVGAHAYALGNDIHFAAGQYDPGSTHGQHLIAHEVAHTVQQRGGAPARPNTLAISTPGDASEVEADQAAVAMVAGRPANLGSTSTIGRMIQRTAAAPAAPAAAPAGPSVGVGAKVGNKSTSLSLSLKIPSPPIKTKYATVAMSATATITGTAEYPNLLPDSAPDVEYDASTDSTGTSKQATEATLTGPKLALVENTTKAAVAREGIARLIDLYSVKEATIEPFAKGGREDESSKDGATKSGIGGSIGATLMLTLGNGEKVPVVGTLVGLKVEGGVPSFSGPNAVVVIKGLDVPFGPVDAGGGCTSKGNFTISGTAVVTPNVTEELAKRATEKVLERMGQKAAEKATETVAEKGAQTVAEKAAALNAAAFLEIGGFAAIAISMGYALYSGASSVSAIKDYAARGERAITGFTAGGMTALGCPGGDRGDPQYFVKGLTTYAGKLTQMVAALQSRPEIQELGFSDAEIQAAMAQAAQAEAGQLRAKIESVARPAIAKAFAEEYYREKEGWLFKSEDRRDAERVATRLGATDVRLDEDGNAYEVED